MGERFTGIRNAALAAILVTACGAPKPTEGPTPQPTPKPTELVTPMPTPLQTEALPTPTGTILVTFPPSPSATPKETPVVTASPEATPTQFPDTPSGFLDRALAEAEQNNASSVNGSALKNSVDDAIKSNASFLPSDYPQSVNSVPQVKYCITGTEPGLPSQDKDLARSLECADTATFALIGWLLTAGSPNREKFRDAFNDAVYFMDNNITDQQYINQGQDRIRNFVLPSL